MVAKHMGPDHSFFCITEHMIPEVTCCHMNGLDPKLGWWNKRLVLTTFTVGRNLYIDLDTVVVGDLERLLTPRNVEAISMPANWAQSGHGGCQSSVMAWTGNFASAWDMFVARAARKPRERQLRSDIAGYGAIRNT